VTKEKIQHATATELMSLSLAALRLFGYVNRRLDESGTDRVWIPSQEALRGADLMPTQLAAVQIELVRAGLLWIRHGQKHTKYQYCPPHKRSRRDHVTCLSKPRDSETTTSKAYEGEGWRVSKEPN
jgi:hypothetical protein